jgi:lipopolysaccharide/colanic/teichoic acid biosynthesis glycosyltransferase
MYSGTEMARMQLGTAPETRTDHDTAWHATSSGIYAAVKPAADYVLAAILLILLAPLIVAAAAIVRLTSRGPAFYSQVRMGLGGRPYRIFKLRTMVHNCEAVSGARWAVPGDARVTPIGRILRATHIDEMPQLLNVLRGEMSLVGPRPERPEFVPGLAQAIPHYRERLLVRPGVTGLAQVQLPPDTDLDSVRRKLACDLFYIHNMGPWLDLRILLCTACKFLGIPFVLSGNLCGVPSQRRHRIMLALHAQLAH